MRNATVTGTEITHSTTYPATSTGSKNQVPRLYASPSFVNIRIKMINPIAENIRCGVNVASNVCLSTFNIIFARRRSKSSRPRQGGLKK